MTQTITIRYRLYVDDPTPLVEVSEAYRDACNHISEYMFDRGMDDVPSFRELHDRLYFRLRTLYGLKAQMAQAARRVFGFGLHDKVVVVGSGQTCRISGLRTSGYFALRILNDDALLNPNYSKLKLLERAGGLIMVPSILSKY